MLVVFSIADFTQIAHGRKVLLSALKYCTETLDKHIEKQFTKMNLCKKFNCVWGFSCFKKDVMSIDDQPSKSPHLKKDSQMRSNIKTTLICFFDLKGIVYSKFVSTDIKL